MKRRNFLAALAAVIAAPKALLADNPGGGVPWPPELQAKLADPAIRSVMFEARGTSPLSICRRFAEQHQLECHALEHAPAAIFSLPFPSAGGWQGEARWVACLSPRPADEIDRELKYQLAKKLQEIEQYTGLRGYAPGMRGSWHTEWAWYKKSGDVVLRV